MLRSLDIEILPLTGASFKLAANEGMPLNAVWVKSYHLKIVVGNTHYPCRVTVTSKGTAKIINCWVMGRSQSLKLNFYNLTCCKIGSLTYCQCTICSTMYCRPHLCTACLCLACTETCNGNAATPPSRKINMASFLSSMRLSFRQAGPFGCLHFCCWCSCAQTCLETQISLWKTHAKSKTHCFLLHTARHMLVLSDHRRLHQTHQDTVTGRKPLQQMRHSCWTVARYYIRPRQCGHRPANMGFLHRRGGGGKGIRL